MCEDVDISIAVATEKVPSCVSFSDYLNTFSSWHVLQGLMTPIIRNADQKSISAISSEVMYISLNFEGYARL